MPTLPQPEAFVVLDELQADVHSQEEQMTLDGLRAQIAQERAEALNQHLGGNELVETRDRVIVHHDEIIAEDQSGSYNGNRRA